MWHKLEQQIGSEGGVGGTESWRCGWIAPEEAGVSIAPRRNWILKEEKNVEDRSQPTRFCAGVKQGKTHIESPRWKKEQKKLPLVRERTPEGQTAVKKRVVFRRGKSGYTKWEPVPIKISLGEKTL